MKASVPILPAQSFYHCCCKPLLIIVEPVAKTLDESYVVLVVCRCDSVDKFIKDLLHYQCDFLLLSSPSPSSFSSSISTYSSTLSVYPYFCAHLYTSLVPTKTPTLPTPTPPPPQPQPPTTATSPVASLQPPYLCTPFNHQLGNLTSRKLNSYKHFPSSHHVSVTRPIVILLTSSSSSSFSSSSPSSSSSSSSSSPSTSSNLFKDKSDSIRLNGNQVKSSANSYPTLACYNNNNITFKHSLETKPSLLNSYYYYRHYQLTFYFRLNFNIIIDCYLIQLILLRLIQLQLTKFLVVADCTNNSFNQSSVDLTSNVVTEVTTTLFSTITSSSSFPSSVFVDVKFLIPSTIAIIINIIINTLVANNNIISSSSSFPVERSIEKSSVKLNRHQISIGITTSLQS